MAASPRLDAKPELLQPSGDVDGVIPKSFEVSSNQPHLDCHGHRDRTRREFCGEPNVKVVDLVVAGPQQVSGLVVAAGVRRRPSATSRTLWHPSAIRGSWLLE